MAKNLNKVKHFILFEQKCLNENGFIKTRKGAFANNNRNSTIHFNTD